MIVRDDYGNETRKTAKGKLYINEQLKIKVEKTLSSLAAFFISSHYDFLDKFSTKTLKNVLFLLNIN